MCATLKWYLGHRYDCQQITNTNSDKNRNAYTNKNADTNTNTNIYTNRNTNLWHRYDCQLITRAGIRRLRNHLPNIKVFNNNNDINNQRNYLEFQLLFRFMHILLQWPPLPPLAALDSVIVVAAQSSSKRGPSPQWQMDSYQVAQEMGAW